MDEAVLALFLLFASNWKTYHLRREYDLPSLFWGDSSLVRSDAPARFSTDDYTENWDFINVQVTFYIIIPSKHSNVLCKILLNTLPIMTI